MKKSILVVEDEKAIADIVKKGLEMAGYVVEVASNGEDALKMLLETKYDAALLDVMLPQMTGIEVLKLARKSKVNIPVMMLTARDAAEERNKALEAGANDYLLKPFSFNELVSRVEALVK